MSLVVLLWGRLQRALLLLLRMLLLLLLLPGVLPCQQGFVRDGELGSHRRP